MKNTIDYNDLFILNDLSVDRSEHRKKVRPIEGTSWSVDNRGVVYSSRNKVVVPTPLWDGSLRVRPVYDGKQVYAYVNHLVLTAFGTPRPSPKHVPWHRDGDRSNCALTNLSWVVLSKQGD